MKQIYDKIINRNENYFDNPFTIRHMWRMTVKMWQMKAGNNWAADNNVADGQFRSFLTFVAIGKPMLGIASLQCVYHGFGYFAQVVWF